jgi:hypothetical protein
MKYKIYWIEWHNPANWESLKKMEEDYGGIVTGSDDEGWVELECFREFEANTIEEAKNKALDLCESDTGVFVVKDEQGNTVFTEEDIENCN